MSLGKLTWLIFLMNWCFIEQLFWILNLKNCHSFSGRTDVFWFVSSFYWDALIQIFCGYSRSRLILFIFWIFDSTFSYSHKQFLSDACYALLEFFRTCNVNVFCVTVMFPFWQHFFCAIYFCSIMTVVHRYKFIYLDYTWYFPYLTPLVLWSAPVPLSFSHGNLYHLATRPIRVLPDPDTIVAME